MTRTAMVSSSRRLPNMAIVISAVNGVNIVNIVLGWVRC